MELHTTCGAELLSRGPVQMPDFMVDAAQYHHEGYDGRGYHGLVGEAIPFVARIIGIADAYDALRAERVYKRGLPEDETLLLMTREGYGFGRRSFDPVLLRAFVRLRLRQDRGVMAGAAVARLTEFASSDPMDDLPPGGPVTVKPDGHRIIWSIDGNGRRRQAAVVRPDGSRKIMDAVLAAPILAAPRAAPPVDDAKELIVARGLAA